MPSEERLDLLTASIRAALERDLPTALRAAEDAEYELCVAGHGADSLMLWKPDDPGKGGALLALRAPGARQVVLEVPHPFYDVGTLSEGVVLFKELEAQALLVSANHRCASRTPSGCSGRAGPCGGGPGSKRASDPAHYPGTLFHKVHEVLADAHEDALFVSLHGMSGRGISLSDGTTLPAPPGGRLSRIAASLQLAFPRFPVTTCNPFPGANVRRRFCGTANVQGRHLNGSGDVCTKRAKLSSGRFLHLEQSLEVRARVMDVVLALKESLPP